MSQLVANSQFDMSAFFTFGDLLGLFEAADVLVHTSTRFEIKDVFDTQEVLSLTGTFGGYTSDFYPTTGTITGATYAPGNTGFSAFTFSSASISVVDFTAFVNNNDIQGLFAQMLQGADLITGSSANDVLYGFAGADVIDGGGGNDLMYGGSGNDTYKIDVSTDIISENGGEGTDTVEASASYTLATNVENLTLVGTGNINGTGNSASNTIIGNAGANVLNGAAGADILTGGSGVDAFQSTASGLSGDTITDLSLGERIVITDANIATFAFNLSGSTLTYSGGSLTITGGVNGSLVASAASGGGVQLTVSPFAPIPDAANDFNGDGRSDILWRNANGDVTSWLGQANGNFAGSAAFNNPGAGWTVVGTGDFNGDGRDDILWRDNSGTVTNWLGQANGNFTGNAANSYNALDNGWSVEGTGDFNGDGRDDILWRNGNGDVTNWLGQANGNFAGSATFNNPGAGWTIAGTGDFNGDGRDDILWRNANGDVTNWLGQANANFTGNAANSYNNPGAGWSVAGTGDFNGDGRDDILWRNANGDVTNWLGQANGNFTGNAGVSYNALDNGWTVEGVGDFNGDGRDDILWRNANGDVTNWLGQANGNFTGNAGVSYNALDNGWQVQPDLIL